MLESKEEYKKLNIRFMKAITGINFRKLARFLDYVIAFATKEYYIFDSSLNELARRKYSQDHIEGKFSNMIVSLDQSHMILLFGSIYFVTLKEKPVT